MSYQDDWAGPVAVYCPACGGVNTVFIVDDDAEVYECIDCCAVYEGDDYE